jgi:hypothetical protein
MRVTSRLHAVPCTTSGDDRLRAATHRESDITRCDYEHNLNARKLGRTLQYCRAVGTCPICDSSARSAGL